MNMKKLIQRMTDIENGKTKLNESSVAECGDMGMAAPAPAPENPGNPVTASITLNASGMEHVADLMRLLQQAGLEKAGPVAPAPLPMRSDMERLRDKMAGLEGPPSAPKPQYFDADDVTGGGDDIHSKKEPEDIRIKDGSLADDVRDSEIEEWDNEPEEEYQDHNYMLKDLAGGINREKRQYKAAQPGDNAMAAESIKDRLYKALSEKKAKPDYLDLDGDGDTKEPMKKAAKDAKKKKTNESAGNIDNAIRKIFGKIYDRGDDGLDYLDNNAPFYDKLASMYNGDLDQILANISDQEKMKLGKELKSALDSMSFELESTTREAEDDRDELTKKLFPKRSRADMEKADRERNRKMNQKRFMKPGKPSRSGEWNTYEAEVQAPTHELSDVARQATRMAQKIKRKINSGEQMEDRDYNQLAELGAILSKFGASYGPRSMKDVMTHMKQYTDDRNQEGHGYPEFDVNRFKELISMTKATGEAMVGEISDKTRNSYVKKATKSHDDAQASGDKKTMSKRGRGLDSAYDSGIRSDKKRREANSKKGEYDYNFGYGESVTNEISPDLAKRYTKAAKMDRDFNDDDIARLSKSGQSTQDMHRRNAKRTKGINRAAKRM
jgi:hypothetical protein